MERRNPLLADTSAQSDQRDDPVRNFLSTSQMHALQPRLFDPQHRPLSWFANINNINMTLSRTLLQGVRTYLVALVLGVGAPLAISAQSLQTIELPDSVACTRCRITLTRVGTLRGADDVPEHVSAVRSIERTADHGYIASFVAADNRPHVYDSTGRFRFMVNPAGDGPFRGHVTLVKGAGGLTLDEDIAGRLHHYSPGYTPLSRTGTTLLSPVKNIVALPAGGYLASANIFSPQKIGKTLHVLDSAGHAMKAIVVGNTIYRSDRPSDRLPLLTMTPDGTTWSLGSPDYVLRAWDREGVLRRTLVRRVAWFTPSDTLYILSPTRAPNFFVVDIASDGEGLLWVLLAVPRKDGGTATSWTAVDTALLTRGLAPVHPEALFESVIEVVDPARARVVTSMRTREPIVLLLESGGAVTARRLPNGDWRHVVWRLQLTGR